MTIANQIQRIKTNITNAYQEIEKFNVNVTEYNNKSDKLAQAISQITVDDTINNQNKTITENGTYSADEGYTGLGEVVVNVPTSSVASTPQITPVGLRVWLDAIDNKGEFSTTRFSGDSNKWHPLVGINSWANPVTTSRANSFDEDSTTFTSTTGYGFYGSSPYGYTDITDYNKECTLELVFTLNEILSTTQQLFGNLVPKSGGYSIRVDKNGNLYGSCYVGTSKTYTVSPYKTIPTGAKIYCCFRVKEGEIHFFNSYYGSDESAVLADSLSDLPNIPLTIGYCGDDTGKYASNPSHITVNSARMYTRYISDEEMMNNYQYDKARFNITASYNSGGSGGGGYGDGGDVDGPTDF